MRILMVAQYGYIRILREALALKSRGHQVDVACQGNLFGREKLDTFSLYRGDDQLRRVVEASPADVVHVFNEPDTLVSVVRSATTRPVIFDIQDLTSLRWGGPAPAEECAAFAAADGVVHISEVCRKVAEKHHGKKPAALLACYVNEPFHEHSARLPEPCWEAMVYEGAIATTDPEQSRVRNFRGLESVVKAFASQGFGVHIFPAGDPPPPGHYEDLGAVVHGGLFYPSLLRAIRPYGIGFVGSPFTTDLMDAALPNKLYEYMSQGVVPVVWNAATAAEFVESQGIGIALKSLDNLRNQIVSRVKECRKQLLKKRWLWTMENHISRVEVLYEDLLRKAAA